MPLLRVYKDIFENIKDGTKTIEVRNRLIRGDEAVFLCGRNVVRKRITGTKEFLIDDGFLLQNWKSIMPKAQDLESARNRLLEIFPNNNKFYAYFIE